ncbi:urease accessory protein UreD [Enterococcus hirae]|uniref:urease accessory protein UreD n=1 Tax=Enterococcus hirae TaxID=1354 RepID=UPI0027C80727|nr:urease accessory protein UreD [Enterococcus hirae]MDQ2183112.1 urease accessory protein UreD [Enterococcus hirae]
MKDTYDGIIDMNFIYKYDRTIADKTYRKGNFRISSMLRNTDIIPQYFIISTGGGYVEGESYLQKFRLDQKSHVILTTQTPNYIFKCDNRKLTKQTTEISLEKDSFLEYYTDEIIPYKDAMYRQDTNINMKKGSKLILTDGLTSGWSKNQALFQYKNIMIKTQISMDNELILNDCMVIDSSNNNIEEIGIFEGKKCFNSVVIIDETINNEIILKLQIITNNLSTNSILGISLLEKYGLVVRILGDSIQDNQLIMQTIINYYRRCIYNLSSLNLRKFNF